MKVFPRIFFVLTVFFLLIESIVKAEENIIERYLECKVAEEKIIYKSVKNWRGEIIDYVEEIDELYISKRNFKLVFDLEKSDTIPIKIFYDEDSSRNPKKVGKYEKNLIKLATKIRPNNNYPFSYPEKRNIGIYLNLKTTENREFLNPTPTSKPKDVIWELFFLNYHIPHNDSVLKTFTNSNAESSLVVLEFPQNVYFNPQEYIIGNKGNLDFGSSSIYECKH